MTGQEFATAARAWIGTPYRHQHAVRGAGTDCLGLVLGLWREAVGPFPAEVPPYTPDWDEAARREALWQAAARYLVPARGDIGPGQVLLFRMRRGMVAKHLGVAVSPDPNVRFVHAYAGHGVVESHLTPGWRARLVARFNFPGEDA